MLVIGGGSSIGRAVAEAAVCEGATVVVATSNAEKVARAAQQLGASTSSAILDVIDESAVVRFFAEAGGFDHIAFTAGDWSGQRPGPLAEPDLKQAPQGLNIRFWSAIMVAKHEAIGLPPSGSLTLTSGMLAHQPTG